MLFHRLCLQLSLGLLPTLALNPLREANPLLIGNLIPFFKQPPADPGGQPSKHLQKVTSPVYYRFDIGLNYRINKKKMTHTIMFDIQNVTNRENILRYEYNDELQELEKETQTGFFPFVNYRIEF